MGGKSLSTSISADLLKEFEQISPRPAGAIRILHASDLLLESPFQGVVRRDARLLPELTEASLRAFDRLVEVALRRQVQVVLLAGGVCEGVSRGPRAFRRFQLGMERLSNAGIRVVWVEGERDAGEGWSAPIRRLPGVFRFSSSGIESIRIELPDSPPIRIHGYSYAAPGGAAGGSGNSSTVALESRPFSALFRRNEEPAIQIGLVWAHVGADSGDGMMVETRQLSDVGLDYWALGGSGARRDVPLTRGVGHYPGTPQGRGFGESELGAKGCSIVDILPSSAPRIQFVRLEAVVLARPVIDATGIADRAALVERVRQVVADLARTATGRVLLVRPRIIGSTALHHFLLSEAGQQDLLRGLTFGDAPIWVDEIDADTRAAIDRHLAMEKDDLCGEIARFGHEFSGEEVIARAIEKNLARTLEGPARQRWQDASPEVRAKWVAKAADLAMSLVRSQEGA